MDVGLRWVAAVTSLSCGVVAGCFSLNFNGEATAQGCDCTDPGLPPLNATAGTNDLGCPTWVCKPGFVQCGGGIPCGTDLLTDAQSCGACGNACGGGPCTQGSCHPVTVLTTGLPEDVLTMAVDSTFVYLASTSQGILRVPKTGGAPEELAPLSGGLADSALAADATGVYWMSDGNLVTATMPGQTPVVLAPLSEDDVVGPLLLDATYVYWMTIFGDETPDGGSSNGNVWRAPKAGGAAEVLAPIEGQQFYEIAPLATSQGSVAFVDVTQIRVAAAGGAVSTVAVQAPGVSTLAADDQSIFWISGPAPELTFCIDFGGQCPTPDAGPDGIFSVGWDGGATSTVSSTGQLAGLQAFAGGLWGVGGAGTTLERVDIATGEHAVFAGGGAVSAFVLDATTVFWTRDDTLLASPQ